jgi:hypothetical protein
MSGFVAHTPKHLLPSLLVLLLSMRQIKDFPYKLANAGGGGGAGGANSTTTEKILTFFTYSYPMVFGVHGS